MHEFDWSSIGPGLPYLMQGMVITLKITVTGDCLRYRVGYTAGGNAPVTFKPISWFASGVRQSFSAPFRW